nr:MAG TPA: hypothetical protein [Caudoviricetes sp.]
MRIELFSSFLYTSFLFCSRNSFSVFYFIYCLE